MHDTLQRISFAARARRLLWVALVTMGSGALGCAGTSSPSSRPPPPPVSRVERAPETARSPASEPPALPSDDGLAARFANAPSLARFSGEASYYSDALAGRKTASGEVYQPRALTAAHRSLPFASVVKVTRLDTGQVVYVRITDRGPFVRGRVLDLSRAAAEQLEMIGRGIAKVRVDVVAYGPVKQRKSARHRKKKKR